MTLRLVNGTADTLRANAQASRAATSRNERRRANQAAGQEHRLCTGCLTSKPYTQFWDNTRRVTRKTCTTCRQAKRRARNTRTKNAAR